MDGRSQGTFVNLGFESPLIPLAGGPQVVSVADALPGWSSYLGDTPNGDVFFNANTPISGAAISVLGSDFLPTPSLAGNYSVELFNGRQLPLGDGRIASLGQTGTIPANSLSLRFIATSLSPVVTFAGTPIGLSIVNSTATYNVFAGDITALAGQTGELRFSHTGMFDVVTFSTLPVPEPGTAVLLSVGAILLWTRLRQRR